MKCVAHVEIDPYCRRVLAKHWNLPCFGDVRNVGRHNLPEADLICGGDPCPRHSRARSNGAANTPDLAGYFLAVVGRQRPRWVVRENVPSPTVEDFDAALNALGYGTAIVRLDAAEVTGQSRQRDFVCGCFQRSRLFVRKLFADAEDGPGPYTTRLGARKVAPCLTTHRTRYDSRDCYIWEQDVNRLRILDDNERGLLAGFPAGWLDGFSSAACARMYGNAVVPQGAEWIGRRIVEANAAGPCSEPTATSCGPIAPKVDRIHPKTVAGLRSPF